jgi:hypothetical protein
MGAGFWFAKSRRVQLWWWYLKEEITMTDVPVYKRTVSALIARKRLVAVTDSLGKLVGYFAPVVSRLERARRLGLPDPESVREQAATTEKTFTTAEVKAYLKSFNK